MAEEIAARDAYARQIEADVVEVTDDGLVLDPTVFYARGGGQPGDQGLIRWPGGEVRVVDTVRKDGTTVHLYEGSPPAPGTRVVAEVDWERRYLLMRTHTALHALSAIIWRDFDAKVTGGNMEPGTARMDFELEGISVEFGQQVLELLGGRKIDSAWAVPGGVRTPLSAEGRGWILGRLPEAKATVATALQLYKGLLDGPLQREQRTFGDFPSLFMALVGPGGEWEHHGGRLRFMDSSGSVLVDQLDPQNYRQYIGEAVQSTSYLKSPYFKSLGP